MMANPQKKKVSAMIQGPGKFLQKSVVVNDVQPKDRDIAMVFQNYALYPHMTVYQNMAFGLKLRKFPKAEINQRVKEAAEVLEITEFLDRKPKALSGGQRQRVAMGRAIVREPKAFLMDEPLSNLDAKLRVQMRTELGRLHNRLQTTTVYVTHDQVEAMTLGHRVAVLRAVSAKRPYNLQQVAPPIEIYRRPGNTFVADFMGMPRINLFEAKFTENGGPKLRVQDFDIPINWKPNIENVIVGARPEDITVSTDTSAIGTDFTVYSVLPNGPDLLLQLQRGDLILTTRMSHETLVDVDQIVKVAFLVDAINIFDAKSGELISPSPTTIPVMAAS